MDAEQVREQVAGRRFAADLRPQFEMLADAAPAAPRSRKSCAGPAGSPSRQCSVRRRNPRLRRAAGSARHRDGDRCRHARRDEGAPGVQTVHLRLMSLSRYGGEGDKDAPDYREWMKEELTLSVTGDYRGESRGTDPANGIVRSEFGYDATRHELRVASRNQGRAAGSAARLADRLPRTGAGLPRLQPRGPVCARSLRSSTPRRR